jgi:hypothetical protein
MEGAKITGITLSVQGDRKRVVVTYDKLREGPVELKGAEGAYHVADLNSIIFDAYGSGGANLSNAQNVIQYWLRN